MADRSMNFGSELRRLRRAAGLSLAAFAERVHYSKGHLSRLESGARMPTPEVARQCDAALGAGGSLVRLGPDQRPGPPAPRIEPAADEWTVRLSADGDGEFLAMPRRGLLGAGAVSIASWVLRPLPSPRADSGRAISVFRSVFDQLRLLGQTVSPGIMVPGLVTQTHILRSLARQVTGTDRRDLLLLASRFAEYTGWMSQEAGDDRASLWWTDRAVELADAAGDRELAAYASVRQALVALYRRDGRETIDLANRAEETGSTPKVKGLAALRAAQGWARLYDYNECMRALDRASVHLDRGATTGERSDYGSWAVRDQVRLTTAWCLHDLGRASQAAELLEAEVARIPAGAVRARTRYGARLAMTLAAAGDIERACAVAHPVLAAVPAVDSATIRADVRDLEAALERWRSHPPVRDLLPDIADALHAPVRR